MSKLIAYFLLFLTLGSLFLSAHVSVVAAEDEDLDEDADVSTFDEDDEPQTHAPTPNVDDEDDDEEETEYEGDEESEGPYLTASPDVTTSFIFPDYPDKRIPVGTRVTLLVGFHNTGDKTFNVTDVQAHLHSPYDYTYYIQNFTARSIGATVEPRKQLSIEYSFQPHENLEPLEFWLSAYVYYNDSEAVMYRSTIINGTIEIIDKPSTFDVQGLFSYVLLVGVLGLIGYLIFNAFGLSKYMPKRGKSKKSTPQTAARAAEAQQSWATKAYKPLEKPKAVGRR